MFLCSFYSFKHIFPIERQIFVFLQHRNLQLIAHSALHFISAKKKLFQAEILRGGETRGNQRRLTLTLRGMWHLFPTKLTDGFHCSCRSVRLCALASTFLEHQTIDLRKSKVIIHYLVSCTHRNFQLCRNLFFCKSSVSQNKYINYFRYACYCGPAWTVFIWKIVSDFFKQFNSFVEFFTKTHHTFFGNIHMVCTSQPPFLSSSLEQSA